MTRLLAAAALSLLLAAAAQAQVQLRTLPAQAQPGKLSHVREMIVTIDGKLARLARGAQVRDQANRILTPMSVPADSFVAYTLNPQGEVSAVWILTRREAAGFPVTLPAPIQ
ncbi:MAG: hypothetical protein ACREVQ_00365 [Burkholderiales bacterium]